MLRTTVTDEWESLDQVLREHASVDLGHPHIAGTGLWHLRHTVEIFRIHAAAASNGELSYAGDIPQNPAAIRDTLLAQIDEFIVWTGGQSAKRLRRPVYYGKQLSFVDMLGIMSRHITWHAAAVHYWVKWKSQADAASAGGGAEHP
jgi:hypothetical protein